MTAQSNALLPRFGKPELRTAIVTAILVPIVVLAHEAGHFLAGLAFNVPNPKLGLSGFTHGPAPWLDSWQMAVIGFAGPAVTFALALGGLALTRPGPTRLASAVSVAACTRLIELLPFGLMALAWRVGGSRNLRTTFDEDRIFTLLGLPGDVALITTCIGFLAILYVVLRRQSKGSAVALVVGGLTGWAVWKMLLA